MIYFIEAHLQSQTLFFTFVFCITSVIFMSLSLPLPLPVRFPLPPVNFLFCDLFTQLNNIPNVHISIMLKVKRLQESNQNSRVGSLARLDNKLQRSIDSYHSNLLQSKSRKPFVHRVTLKLLSNELNQKKRSGSRLSNFHDEQLKTPRPLDDKFEKLNIKTFVRFRPLTGMELEMDDGDVECFSVANNNTVVLGDCAYSFDRVFMPQDSQTKVFESSAKEMVKRVLEGYNATLFAYGQTGSGKTFTMFGDHRKGIIPLSVQELFRLINPDTTRLFCSLLQIYKQTLIDLINPQRNDLKIKQTTAGIGVANLTIQEVASQQSLMQLVNRANETKKIRETNLNQNSSRSHFIFVLTIEQRNQEGQLIKSKLNLIDLAGSEKVYKSKADGESLEEAKKINLSLSCLGNTINALIKGQEHVPFRESKLTRLLQESLVGNCLTSLIVTCSSHHSCNEQTISSLKFASRVKNIKTAVSQNIIKQPYEIGIKKALYENLKFEYEFCQNKIQRVKQLLESSKRIEKRSADKLLTEIEQILEGGRTKAVSTPIDNASSLNPSHSYSTFGKSRFVEDVSPLRKDSLVGGKESSGIQGKLHHAMREIDDLKLTIVNQEAVIDKQEKKIKELTQKLNNFQSGNTEYAALKEATAKQLMWLQKDKESYYHFERKILEEQVSNLMKRLCVQDAQSKELVDMEQTKLNNKFQNDYIQVLQNNLAAYVRLFRKFSNQSKPDYQQKRDSIDISIDRQLLPLTYTKAIQELKRKNEQIRQLQKHAKQSRFQQQTSIKYNKLKDRMQVMQAQLKFQAQKNRLYESYRQCKPK